MRKVVFRLLSFFVGIPIIICIVIWPSFNHLPFHIILCISTAIGSNELYNIFSINHKLLQKKCLIVCSTLIPFIAGLYAVLPSIFNITIPYDQEIVTFTYIMVILVLLFLEVWTATDFKDSLDRIASSIFVVTYTGFLISFISRMTLWQINETSIITPCICIFLLMVFFTDSIAWFMGVLFGKGTRGFVKASPNKSLVGFLGGFIGASLAGVIGYYFWKDLFEGGLIKLIITGIFIAFSSIVGDLAESVFKRSCGIKDSGNIIPGRGGMLDSLDSILMSAPIFYALFSLFFGPFN